MRRAIAIGVLAWVALWPFAHRVLVAVYDVNPWKLGGFAMYTTATPPLQVVVFEPGPDGARPLDERSLPASARDALREFRVERHALGRLRAPDEAGRAVLEARTDLPWVIVAVQRMHLDPQTARMTSSKQRYLYERSPPDPRV